MMEHLTLHHLWQNMNDRTMTLQQEAFHNERTHHFQTLPLASLLQIIYHDTPDYMERCSYLIQLCHAAIEPIMTGLLNKSMMFDVRQDLLDLLASLKLAPFTV
jgi:hypothetical protein